MLLSGLREDMEDPVTPQMHKLQLIQTLFQLEHYDYELISQAANMVKQRKIRKMEHLTDILSYLAKFRHQDDIGFLDEAIEIICAEPKLDMRLASKNMFNLLAFDYRSDEALDKFAETVNRVGNAYEFHISDLAVALKCFS